MNTGWSGTLPCAPTSTSPPASRPRICPRIKYKSKMKEYYQKAGIATARYHMVDDYELPEVHRRGGLPGGGKAG